MKFYFPVHLDGGNRGCEAIARGTAEILKAEKENLIGYCRNIETDKKLGLNKVFTLKPMRKHSLFFKISKRIYKLFIHNAEKQKNFEYAYDYDKFIDEARNNDILFSTGGDMFCYDNNQVNYIVDYAKKNNKHMILWGCSIGKENLTKEKIESLRNFDAIFARESITRDLFIELGLKNIFLYPDPAFILKAETCKIPDFMLQKQIIGINLSNFVNKDVSQSSLLGKNIRNLLSYILNDTSYSILLIPHVFWKNQDDRIICNQLLKEFQSFSDRIEMLDSINLNYCQIRHIISKCTMFIGARTHAVISAYSMCIPTLALGYSVKSKGIAKDLGLPHGSVVNTANLSSENDLVNAFIKFLSIESQQHEILTKNIPTYISSLNSVRKDLYQSIYL